MLLIMDLRSVIDEVANDADECFADCESTSDCRDAIKQLVSERYPALSIADRRAVVNGVIAILQEEDFFVSDARELLRRGDTATEVDEA